MNEVEKRKQKKQKKNEIWEKVCKKWWKMSEHSGVWAVITMPKITKKKVNPLKTLIEDNLLGTIIKHAYSPTSDNFFFVCALSFLPLFYSMF